MEDRVRTMAPRIDSAEVISFRLKVPRLELDRVPQGDPGREMGLTLTEEDGDLVLAVSEGDSYLRFRPIGPEAVLTDIYLFRDPDGEFLLRVLGPLMIRFAGDLQLHAVWSIPERNSEGDHAEVKITRGITDYPGLVRGSRNTVRAGGADLADRSPEEREVQQLLEKARAHFQEYLRLKKEQQKK